MYPVEIREEPARRLAAMPHIGPYSEIGRAYDRLLAVAADRGLQDQMRGMVGVFHDDPYQVAPANLRSHAGMEVGPRIAVDQPLEKLSLVKGRHAVLRLTGPYAGLPAAYDYLYHVWLPGSGEVAAKGPSYERYLNSPMDTALQDLVTEICVPLQVATAARAAPAVRKAKPAKMAPPAKAAAAAKKAPAPAKAAAPAKATKPAKAAKKSRKK